MFKKLFAGLFVITVACFCVANSAHAEIDKIQIQMVNEFAHPKTTFEWDEIPWICVFFPEDTTFVNVSWWGSSCTKYYCTLGTPSASGTIVASLNNGTNLYHMPVSWTDAREPGYWSVSGYAHSLDGGSTAYTGFTVAPEPVSSALFLIGGASLVAIRKKRKNRVV